MDSRYKIEAVNGSYLVFKKVGKWKWRAVPLPEETPVGYLTRHYKFTEHHEAAKYLDAILQLERKGVTDLHEEARRARDD